MTILAIRCGAATAALLALLAGAQPGMGAVLDGPAALFGPAACVPDAVLAAARGGVTLPNGMEVALAIRMDSYVDGQLALRSVFAPAADGSGAGDLRVFTGKPDMPAVPAVPRIVIPDLPGADAPLPVVNVSTGPSAEPDPAADGATAVPLQFGGAATETPSGAVRVVPGDAGGSVVVLEAPTIELRHLLGAATGQIVANSGNDRRIDTVTELNVELQGDLQLGGSELLRVEAMLRDAAGSAVR